ncbi:chromosome segregation protein SMC [Bifidobacterium leontopitheci]|uniref:Chromosome partition protein Smc n=1 Tax=Bifidobacterium leontopitheci TaxID=2650774 RepID=A0A6I1GI58_9BIFI|nr:chromosome segregation protein SMC [Bifidobacterium leontopitheci]KAB7791343.1 chromosome segregation protein SMC [Bifidobacterium leontopitheci]
MYLKELTLRGFKSFASATTLRFEPGITAVVGPNGSGKSNIVDALTWVMGEQGAKNLRGTSMEDVIFAGTSSRPPLGRAQVSLTIDNTDHALDIDYTEVTISRTIFRNGGSEYAINGSPCRLLDIQELLSDTGLGQQMHVIVGQGRLDSILRADPSGHRAFIEEAAGILKHRKRKERALRKLANTQANLDRLDDLLKEIRRQMGPLGRQARISRRADGIRVTLRDAQSRLYADDAVAATRKRDEARRELAAVRGELQTAQGELAKVKVRIEQIEALTAQSSPALARVNQTWHEMTQLKERFTALASLADERSRSLLGQIVTSLGEDPDMLNRRADELERQAAEQSRQVDDTRIALDQAIQSRADDEKRLAALRQTITELRKATQRRQSQVAELKTLIAREEAAVQLGDTRAKDLATQHDDLTGQFDQARTQRDTLAAKQDAATDDGTAALDEAKEMLAARQETLDDAAARKRDLDNRIIALQAKADALHDTLEARNASGALEHDDEVAMLGRLADFIHVEDGWENAVARALGEFAAAMIVPGETNLLHALTRAHEEHLGKAVMLMPDDGETAETGGAGADDDSDAETAAPQNGLQSRSVASLVTVSPAARDSEQAQRVVTAARSLLGDVAAVDTVEEALAAVHDMSRDGAHDVASGVAAARGARPRWRCAVTKHGDVINRAGAAGGAAGAQSDLALAARRDKALAQIGELNGRLEALAADVTAATQQRDEARVAVDRAAQRRMQARLDAQQTAKSLAAAETRLSGIERRIADVNDRITRTQEERRHHQLKLDDLTQALAAAQASEDGQTDINDLVERERTLETSLTVTREQETTANIAWNDAKRKAESFTRQAGLLRDNAKEAQRRRERIETMNAQRREQAAHARRIAADAAQAAALMDADISRVVERRERLQRQTSDHDDELRTLRAERGRLEPQVTDLQQREHVLDVNRERLAGEFGQLTQKVDDELGLRIDELIRDFAPDLPVPVLDEEGRPVPLDDGDAGAAATGDDAGASAPARVRTVPYDRAEQRKRLDKARRDLAALGKVNPLAGEEYAALEARNSYLNDQRNDVAKSRDDLLTLIKDLDATMVSVFKAAFDDTAAAFQRVFATLFPGGTGRLRLEDPDDLLATGVIVEASPAGKKVRQLSLLSGGERSLTALALLFAIFTARPSPFYVMDEVEAALDDINLTRLLNALEELRRHAQLIIITHQQRTMSIADALYGVTMRADGVTAVISQKLADTPER